MIKENIPIGYKIFQDKKSLFILKEGFEKLTDSLDWKRPSQILSQYPLHPIHRGRGRAVRIPYDDVRGIFVKKLVHGGLLGNLFKDFFSRKRILGDLINAHSLKIEKLHAPEIIFLIMRKKVGPFYEGYIGEEFLENTWDLIEMSKKDNWSDNKNQVLHAVASELKKLHDKGFYHLDLNAGNILIRETEAQEIFYKTLEEGATSLDNIVFSSNSIDSKRAQNEEKRKYKIFFVDLDKVKKYEKLSHLKRRRNIFRMFRSLKKCVDRKRYSAKDDLIFLKSYCGNDGKMFSLFERFLPLHRISLIFHLPYWKLTEKK